MVSQFYDSWMHVLHGSWLDGTSQNEGLTYPADKPTKRIDYIFSQRSDGIKTKRTWVVETLASDHLPVMAVLEIGSQNHPR
jgi:endonuclease/exonuclease/phosphatase family metal-dependent hydrolase